jgi:hypothetical protein
MTGILATFGGREQQLCRVEVMDALTTPHEKRKRFYGSPH